MILKNLEYILNNWTFQISHQCIYILMIIIMAKMERLKNRDDLNSSLSLNAFDIGELQNSNCIIKLLITHFQP
jgi:hypothetical protein